MRKIKGFNKYKINKNGGVYSLYSNKFLKPFINNSGYKYVDLIEDKSKYRCSIHSLVASTYITNPLNKSTINHKDGDKLNNSITNLEWMTYSENINHAYSVLKIKRYFGKEHKKSIKINQYNKNNKFIKTWDSMMDVQRKLKISSADISKNCNNIRKSAGGFIWKIHALTLQ